MNVWVASQPSMNGECADQENGPLVVTTTQRDALAASFAVLYEAFMQHESASAIERVEVDGDRDRTVMIFVMRVPGEVDMDLVNEDSYAFSSITITRHELATG